VIISFVSPVASLHELAAWPQQVHEGILSIMYDWFTESVCCDAQNAYTLQKQV